MKTKSFILLLGGVLLLAATSCTEPIAVNPNFNPETNKVYTQFVINIAAADEVNTKQLATTAQIPNADGSKFRGINNASLFSFSRGTDYDGKMIGDLSEVCTGDAVKPGVTQDYVDLSTMIPSQSLNLQDNANSSRRILQISLPLGTNGILFYGMAGNGETRAGLSDSDEFGALKMDSEVPLSDVMPMSKIGSSLVSRLENKNALIQVEKIFLVILNNLVKIGFNGEEAWNRSSMTGEKQLVSSGYKGRIYNFTNSTSPATYKPLDWKDYLASYATETSTAHSPLPDKIGGTTPEGATVTDLSASPLEVILGNAYNSIVSFGPNEIRAGSGNSIMRMFQDLFSVFRDGVTSAPVNTEEMIAQQMMIEILKYICLFTNANLTYDEHDQLVGFTPPTTWNSSNNIHGTIRTWDTNQYNYAEAPSYPLNNFPSSFNLPQGSVVIKKNTSGEMFSYYVDDIDISAMGHQAYQTMTIDQYCYPVPLCYYGNSPVRVNNSSTVEEDDYTNGYANWVNDGKWGSSWLSNSHVVSSTRGVAMTYNIQYGVALLESKVQYSSQVLRNGIMYDNNAGLHPREEPNEVKVTDDNSFWLTGILIGGQPNSVDWRYLTKSKLDEDFTMMVYDKAMDQKSGDIYYTPIPFERGGTSTPNYTMLYDNFSGDEDPAEQNVVYVALEFVNKTGHDFWGMGNMVRNEGTFYLIGKLSPYKDENKTPKDFTWPDEGTTKQIVPPFEVDEDGIVKGKKIVRVFIQDFMTKATFTLNQNSLKNAYVTVPDLKASKISLGLSVDLNWQPGIEFTDIPLGNITE